MALTYSIPYWWHHRFIQIFIVHENFPSLWLSLLLAVHFTLSISDYQLAAAAAEQALECHRLFKFQISWFTIFHLCWETESFDKNVLWHLLRKWKECIWINVAKIFTRNHNSAPYKYLSLQPAKAKVSQKYSWKKQKWWGGGWWGYKQIALVWLMTPSYSVPVNPPSPFPISGKPFPPIIV